MSSDVSHSAGPGSAFSATKDGISVQKIESALVQHKQVKEAVVLVKEEQSEGNQFIAYVVPEGASENLVRELRAHLNNNLAPHLIPYSFVLLDTLPLMSDGELDHSGLPPSGQLRARLSTVYQEPKSSIEKKLAQLLSQVLELGPIGREDDFFELGGNSLLAVRFTIGVIETFGVRISPRRFYEGPTVAELAQVVEELLQNKQQFAGGEQPT